MYIGQQSQRAIVQQFAEYVSPGRVETYRALGFAVVPGRREGVRIWDLEGNSYINCRSSGGVFNLGHRPPRVVEAMRRALDELDIGDHMLMSEQRAALAQRLAELTPGDIKYSFFTASGGEAIDLAIKLARASTGRPGIICAEKGYHGHTGLALAATDPAFGQFFGPLAPGFNRVPFDDIQALESSVDRNTAAVILETIPATAGILIPSPGYYPAIREICDRYGALLILDEVQTGLGRTGRMWAIDEWNVVPDLMVLGKGMSGGLYPLSVVCYRENANRFLREHPFAHLSSFGGADLGCVAATAMLDETTGPGFLEHVRAMGSRFAQGFGRLQLKHSDLVAEVRQRGLMIGFELREADMGPMMTAALGRHGVLAVFADFNPSVMQILPPLIIVAEEVDEVLDSTERALGEVAEQFTRGERLTFAI